MCISKRRGVLCAAVLKGPPHQKELKARLGFLIGGMVGNASVSLWLYTSKITVHAFIDPAAKGFHRCPR